MITQATPSERRKTGISVLGDVPWGTHFCCFYETKEDLLETLVAYFKTGLENNEFCVWVVSQLLTKEEARRALGQAVPELDRHLAEGGLEIHGHAEWYLCDGRCDPQRVLQAWREKLNQALASGFAGLRASGDGGWFQENEWMVFRDYEKEVNALIADHRRLLLCTYPLSTSSGEQVFDVACSHQVAVARRKGSWEMIETSELKQAKAEIKRLNEGLEQKVEERTRRLAITVEAVKQAEDRIRLVIDTIPTMAWSLRPDGAVDFVNQPWMDYTGLSFQDAIEEPTCAMHPEELPRIMKKWLAARAARESFDDEMRLRRADGRYRWFLVRTAPLFDEQGNLLKWYGTSTDIEDRKQVEERLRRSEEKFKTLFGIAPVGISVLDRQYNVIDANPALEQITRLSKEELLNGAYRRRTYLNADGTPKPRRELPSERAISENRPVDGIETGIVMENGEIVWTQVSAAPLALPDASAVVITQDITERKRAAEELEEANRQLRILSRQLFHLQEEERRHLARELHDEIGQTLTAAKLNLKIIAPDVPAKISGRLDDSIQLLDRLLKQVRQLSLDLRPPLLDDLGLVPTLRWLVNEQAQRASLRVTFNANVDGLEIDPEVQITCFRVAQEALTNIIRHSDAKSIAVDVRCAAERLWLTVRDDGAGVDPAVLQQKGRPHSTLGLVSMKERALLVQGGLEIHSTPGQGTEIRAWFPLVLPGSAHRHGS